MFVSVCGVKFKYQLWLSVKCLVLVSARAGAGAGASSLRVRGEAWAAGLGGGGEHRCLTRHTGPAATSHHRERSLTSNSLHQGWPNIECFMSESVSCCVCRVMITLFLVLAVTLSVYDGCVAVAGGGRHWPCPPGLRAPAGSHRELGLRPGPARDKENRAPGSYSWLAGRGGGSSGLSLGSRSQSATSPGTRRTGGGQDPETQRPRHPPLSRSGSRHGHTVTVQHTDTCKCWGAVLISSLHNPSPGGPGSRLLSLLCAICQAMDDNPPPSPFTSCQ